jgi:hypothetical protein
MESSLVLIEQQEELKQADKILIEQPSEKSIVTGLLKRIIENQSAINALIERLSYAGSWLLPCERQFNALIPLKYRPETLKKEIVVWASDRQDADELHAILAGSSVCNRTYACYLF